MWEDNLARWDAKRDGFYEVWYLKLNTPEGSALWLRLTTLALKSGLKKIAETWAVFFNLRPDGTCEKTALKNTSSLGAYRIAEDGAIQIEDSVLARDRTSGSVVSRGHRIAWELSFQPNETTFFHVPRALQALNLAKSSVCKPNVSLRFDGWFEIDGKKYECHGAPGCQGHIWGTSYAHEWAWAHCNEFENGGGAVLEALSARVKLGGVLPSPRMSAVYLEYKGERHELNRLWDALAIRSRYQLTGWRLAAERGPLRMSMEIECDVKSLAGVTYEDTRGGFLYCNNTALARLTLSVYFRGKLDATLKCGKRASFETVSREKSRYVELLL